MNIWIPNYVVLYSNGPSLCSCQMVFQWHLNMVNIWIRAWNPDHSRNWTVFGSGIQMVWFSNGQFYMYIQNGPNPTGNQMVTTRCRAKIGQVYCCFQLKLAIQKPDLSSFQYFLYLINFCLVFRCPFDTGPVFKWST
jgi:hypothetical protein